MKQHTKACRGCPWRRDSAAGWLGASNPEEFLSCAEAEVRMPCHNQIDYDRDDWRDQADAAPLCAGVAIHFKNRCKMPLAEELRGLVDAVEKDPNVFTWRDEFLDHHLGKRS